MAGDEENVDIDDERNADADDSTVKKAAKHDSKGATDLEKVTDYVEEAEISSQNISDAMKVVSDRQTREANEKQLKESELSRVKINKEDIDLIVQEMELSRIMAERVLREHKGNVFEALVTLTN